MVKVLSQAGITLADTYNVEGSIAGINDLNSEEVHLTHEMGDTIFAERLSGFQRRQLSGAIIQSTGFAFTMVDLPQGPFRVLAVTLLADVDARMTRVQVAVRDPTGGRETPIFVWNVANDVTSEVRIVENNAAAADLFYFIGNPVLVPTLCIGTGQPQRVGQEIVCRGVTSAFGAGNVNLTLLVYIAFAQVGGISSLGLPIPSW